jgi:uroporphyrinogen decarboxylase
MTRQMTSKERVRTAFMHGEPDRVPINYGANSGIDNRLKAHFGLAPTDSEGLRRRLGVDFRGTGVPYVGPRLHAEIPGRGVDPEWGQVTRWVEHGAGGYWDFCDFPLKEAGDETLAKWQMPSPDHYDYSRVRKSCQDQREFALHVGGAGLGDIINSTGFLFGTERVLVGLAMEDPAMLAFIDRRLAIGLEVTRRVLEAAGGLVDFMWIGEDLGSQRGPLISLDLYRRIIRPRHQQLVDLAKSFNMPVMIHSCGSSSWAYEDFIEMGIGVIDTLQPEAADMSPSYLKAKFGNRLAFHGCISTAGPVSFGTPDQVISSVRETLEIMMPGGGYCLSPTHALQDNSPVENVVAMYEAAQRYGTYR